MSVNLISPIGLSFKGSGSESTGSVAYDINAANIPEQAPDTVEISTKAPNFKARVNDDNSPKGKSALGAIALTTIGAAAAIVGLGFAGKAVHNGKIANETIKNFMDKKVPKAVTDKCYEWCGLAKNYGVKGKTWATETAWPAVKKFFGGKK